MSKLQLGTIGTSWITDSFIKAAVATAHYELNTIYSRNEDSGHTFAEKYGEVNVETDLKLFIENTTLDVIYIASPNSLHFEQSLMALKAKKHVMVEKPATLNVEQWDELLKVAKENEVFILEAARHVHLPNLAIIVDEIKKLGTIRGATLPFLQYSSRYDNVLAGEEPNVFSLKFAGGVLMDLGIYPVYTAVALFGEPKEVLYYAQKIATGADGMGTAIFRYGTFDLTIIMSKNAVSSYETEVYGEEDTLIIDHVTELNKARLLNIRTFEENDLVLKDQHENNMYYEAETLAKMIANKESRETQERYEELSELARIVSGLLHEMRKQANIVFEGE